MTENEKLEEFIKMMKDSNQLTDTQEVQLRMFLSHPFEKLRIEISRYTMKEIILPSSEQHFGVTKTQLGYRTKITIFDELISQIKPTL